MKQTNKGFKEKIVKYETVTFCVNESSTTMEFSGMSEFLR